MSTTGVLLVLNRSLCCLCPRTDGQTISIKHLAVILLQVN